MEFNPLCKHCHRRIWYWDEPEGVYSKKVYAPGWFRVLVHKKLKKYPFHPGYQTVKCEICNRKMAIIRGRSGEFNNRVFAFYRCSFDSSPTEHGQCFKQKTCYNCPHNRTFLKKYYDKIDKNRTNRAN